jgi:hypothetical protein
MRPVFGEYYTASTLTLASAAKIRLIEFYLAAKKFLGIISRCKYRIADQVKGFKRCRITHTRLNRSFVSGDFQFKKLYQPHPGFKRAIKLLYPSAGEVMKSIFTVFASIPFTDYPVDIFAVAPCAKNTSIFPTVFSEVQPNRILGFNNVFKGFKVHGHHYNCRYLVSKLL